MLCSGRCGSFAFFKACEHITNYSTEHEGNWRRPLPERFTYQDRHIEIDNRLAWLLGCMAEALSGEVLYVHLTRNEEDTAVSYSTRVDKHGILKFFRDALGNPGIPPVELARDFVRVVNANIRIFLKNRPSMACALETIDTDFSKFWHHIGAKGDLDLALKEFEKRHNAGCII